jgi:hypothetical protein
MAAHLTRTDNEGFKKCFNSNAVIRLITCCGMAMKRMGMLGVSVRTVKMETVTLMGKGRQNIT